MSTDPHEIIADPPVRGIWDDVYPLEYDRDEIRKVIREEIAEAIGNPTVSGLLLDNTIPRSKLIGVSKFVRSEINSGGFMSIATSSTFLPLPIPFKTSLTLTGRPLKIDIKVLSQAGSAGSVMYSITLDGIEVSRLSNGIVYDNISSGGAKTLSGFCVIDNPPKKTVEVEMVARALVNTGILYVSTDLYGPSMLLTEL